MKNIVASLLTVGTLAVDSALMAPSAEAGCIASRNCIITLEGNDYEITTITTTFNNAPRLIEQPWYGNEQLARDAASQVIDALGFPQHGYSSPYFAYNNTFYQFWSGLEVIIANPTHPEVYRIGVNPDSERTYAIATKVQK